MTLEELIERAVGRVEGCLSTAEEEFMRLCGRRLAAGAGGSEPGAVLGDMAAIRRILGEAERARAREAARLSREIQAVVYDEAKTLMADAGQDFLPFEEFSRHARASPLLGDAAAGRAPMGRSTALSALYRRTIGAAFSGMTAGDVRLDYPRAMRKAIRALSERGMSVVAYASGYKRRLDSSVRADLMDELTEVVQGMEAEVARAAGADGWEISAHDHCAEDHEGVQGRVFASGEFEKLQSGAVAEDAEGGRRQLRRPVGKWNCRHIAYPVILGVSEPAHGAGRLEEIRRRSEAGVEFRGKRMTLYEATQRQRRLETEMRRERGRLACVREVAGSDPAFEGDLRRSRARLAGLREAYKELGALVEPSAIRAKWDRAYNVGARKPRRTAKARPAPSGGLFP